MNDRRLALILGGFVVVGLVLLAFGEDAEARVAGAISVLFFGGGGLAVFGLPLLERRGPAAPRIVEVGGEPAIVFGLSRGRQWLVLVAALLVTTACVVIALAGGTVIGIVGAVVFGAFTLLAVRGLLTPRGLALSPAGITALGYGQGRVAWDDVERVGVLREGPLQLVGIDAARVQRGAFGRWNRRFSSTDLAVPADDAEAVVAALITYLEQPERRLALGTEQELARLSGRA